MSRATAGPELAAQVSPGPRAHRPPLVHLSASHSRRRGPARAAAPPGVRVGNSTSSVRFRSRGSASRRRPPWGCRPCGGAVGPSLSRTDTEATGPRPQRSRSRSREHRRLKRQRLRLSLEAGRQGRVPACRVPARPPSWLTDLSACPHEVGAAWGLLLWGRQARGRAPPAASADPHRLPTPAQWGLGLDLGTWGTQTFSPQGAGE